jgi:magnesium-transporting ATPase (P-type)
VLDDPTRGIEVNEAVSDCKKAGINIKVVSSDSSEATKAVAKDTGILWDFDEMWASHVLLEGYDFRSRIGGIVTHSRKSRWGKDYVKNEKIFREIIHDLKVLSWASSEDKYMLVTGLKNEKFVVGVTGMSPADTKSLLKADVGFTLNELGSEVAKHSSDVILRNDSLKSVVSGIMWGRNLLTNIKAYMQYYMTFVIVLACTVLVSTILEGHIPFNLHHLLWLHILTEFFVMYSLIRNKPSYVTLLENKMQYEKRILKEEIWRNIIMNSLYQTIVLCAIHHQGDKILETNKNFLFDEWNEESGAIFTILFQVMFYFQISNILLSKTSKTYEFNLSFNSCFVIIAMIVIQVLLVNYGGSLLKFIPLNIYMHLFTIVVGFSPLVWGSVVKWLVPLRYFKIRINECELDRNDIYKCIQHYLRENIAIPSKRPVKQKWRSNSQNQYDTKGKRTITWVDEEDPEPKTVDKNQMRVNIISALRENKEGI